MTTAQTVDSEASPLDLIEAQRSGQPVKVSPHRLTREISRALSICKRVGIRLELVIAQAPERIAVIRVHRDDEGRAVPVPMLGDDGKPLTQPWLPDEEWRKAYDRYLKTIVAFAAEQREWAKMTPKEPELTEAETRAELALLTAENIRTMPRAELDLMLAARDAIDATSEVKP